MAISSELKRVLPIVALAAGVTLSACGNEPITDRNGFCGDESGSYFPPGHRIIYALSASKVITGSGSGTYRRGIGNQLVKLSVIGEWPGDVDPQDLDRVGIRDIGVCGGDCVMAKYGMFFKYETSHRTDANGILIYTVDSGPYAAGFILEDWAPGVTCVRGVGTSVDTKKP
ncbi:MAG: hypothetical protein EXR72_02605 [Myxococcales bacterium]|nr:hypothetical protein [Myxococcales bacterium]